MDGVYLMKSFSDDDKLTLVQVMAWCRNQAINRTNVNPYLCRHMPSQGHNELNRGLGEPVI